MKTPPFFLIYSFLAFTEAPNMITAAESLGLSQPALTSHLKQFESYFPQSVFVLEGRKKVLTSFGRQVKSLLQKKFANLNEDLSSLNEQFQDPKNASVRLAGRSEILNFIADKIHFPGSLIFLPTNGRLAVSGLIERKYDIAISNHLEKADQLHFKKLFSDHFCLIVPQGWQKKESTISKEFLISLIEKPYLSYKAHDENLNLLLTHHKIDRAPSFKKVISDWPTLSRLAEAGEGWTIAPHRYAQQAQTARVISISQSLIPHSQFYLLYRKESLSLFWFKDLVQQLL